MVQDKIPHVGTMDRVLVRSIMQIPDSGDHDPKFRAAPLWRRLRLDPLKTKAVALETLQKRTSCHGRREPVQLREVHLQTRQHADPSPIPPTPSMRI